VTHEVLLVAMLNLPLIPHTVQPISEWLARMANSKWRDVIVNAVMLLELARTVCLWLHIERFHYVIEMTSFLGTRHVGVNGREATLVFLRGEPKQQS